MKFTKFNVGDAVKISATSAYHTNHDLPRNSVGIVTEVDHTRWCSYTVTVPTGEKHGLLAADELAYAFKFKVGDHVTAGGRWGGSWKDLEVLGYQFCDLTNNPMIRVRTNDTNNSGLVYEDEIDFHPSAYKPKVDEAPVKTDNDNHVRKNKFKIGDRVTAGESAYGGAWQNMTVIDYFSDGRGDLCDLLCDDGRQGAIPEAALTLVEEVDETTEDSVETGDVALEVIEDWVVTYLRGFVLIGVIKGVRVALDLSHINCKSEIVTDIHGTRYLLG